MSGAAPGAARTFAALAGLADTAPLAAREGVLDMSLTAERAVLTPDDPGGLEAGLRAALARRLARAHGADALLARWTGPETDPALETPGAMPHDARLAAIAAFADRAGPHPAEVEAGDIEALKAAGLPDADIVRLCELLACLAYLVRVVHGLSLLERRL